MLNWIVLIRTVLTLKLYLRYTELFNIELFGHFTVCNENVFLYKTELAGLELFYLTE